VGLVYEAGWWDWGEGWKVRVAVRVDTYEDKTGGWGRWVTEDKGRSIVVCN